MVKLHRISLVEQYILESKDLTLEAKKDLEDLKDFLGDDLFDSYMKIRDRIPKDQNEFKDFNKIKKMDLKDVQDFVDNFKSKSDKKKSDKSEGAKKIYEDSDWVVYKITSYPAAQLYGKGTKWCITGRYPGHEEKGEKYFDDYIQDYNLDGGYYFYISKEDPDDKYCLLQTKDGKIESVWEPTDENLGNTGWAIPSSFPKVPGINIDPKPFKALSRSLISAIKDRNFSDVRDIVKQMKKYNVSLDDTPNGETPPLIDSVYRGLPKIAEYLINNGADINIKGDRDRTPIFYARTIPMINMLINNGADVDIKDLNNNTCLSRILYNCDSQDEKEIKSILFKNMNKESKSSYIKDNISLKALNDMVEKGIISKEEYINFCIKGFGYSDPDILTDFEPDMLTSFITTLKPKDKSKLKNIILNRLENNKDIKSKKVTVDNIDNVKTPDLLKFCVGELWDEKDDRGEGDIYEFLYNDLITEYYSKQHGANLAKLNYNNKRYFNDLFTSGREHTARDIEDALYALEKGGINMDKLISYYDKYIQNS